jgi:membrane fusion protein (multidrug efflux system)
LGIANLNRLQKKMNKGLLTMKKPLLIAVVLLVALLGSIFGIKQWQQFSMQAGMGQAFPPTMVAATEVIQENWVPTLRAVGSLDATNGINVAAEVGGIIKEIVFTSGEQVEQGTILIRLDDAVDRAALDALRADRRLAEIKFNRQKDLLKKKVTSKSEYDASKASFEAASARVAEQEAIINKKVIRAPFSGLLGIREVDLGQYLEPGNRIVSLQALDPIYADYTLPERYLHQVAVGQDVQVSVEAMPGEIFRGTVSAIDSDINRATRTLKIRATLPNSEQHLRPGMFAEVVTLQAESQQVLTVPRTAISYNTYGDFVYLITQQEDGPLMVKRQQVISGESRAGHVAISEGLQAGDRVVRAGLVKLRDGMPISIDNQVELEDARISGE